MRNKYVILAFALFSVNVYAQLNPAITHWIINTGAQTGFGGIPTNVQEVQYSVNNVYVSTTDVADWIPIGYNWPNNPWSPQNQNFLFKITLNPVHNNNTPITTPYGHIGIWTNGVSIYNPKDAHSYLDSSTWFQNAFYFEHLGTETMDTCLGHPNNMYEYHLHVHPKCLWDETDSTNHSPILGFAFDGFPVYGAYGYTNTNGTGPIKRMRSSFRLRNITDRTVMPDGTVLTAPYYGPTLATYPLGSYIQDYEYVPASGDLDDHNGRFCVTPEYPLGIYAYFITLDSLLEPAYPYVLGTTFYGTVQIGNTGPSSGHNVISEPVTVYTSVNEIENKTLFLCYPNPANELLNFYLVPSFNSNMTAVLYDLYGRKINEIKNVQTSVNYSFDISGITAGNYFLEIDNGTVKVNKKIVVIH